jgi:hypothetical protein
MRNEKLPSLYSHAKCYEGYQIKDGELRGARSVYEEIKIVCNIQAESLKGRNQVGEQGVNSRIILKWILKNVM